MIPVVWPNKTRLSIWPVTTDKQKMSKHWHHQLILILVVDVLAYPRIVTFPAAKVLLTTFLRYNCVTEIGRISWHSPHRQSAAPLPDSRQDSINYALLRVTPLLKTVIYRFHHIWYLCRDLFVFGKQSELVARCRTWLQRQPPIYAVWQEEFNWFLRAWRHRYRRRQALGALLHLMISAPMSFVLHYSKVCAGHE